MMKTYDPLFNINFVREIEIRPCLWNYSLPEYCKRAETDRAWAEVADAMKDSVANCRERWRNIRGAFLRSLKHLRQSRNDPGTIAKRKYYLNENLQFLIPYTRSRSKNFKIFADNEDFEELNTELEEETELKTELNYTESQDIPQSNLLQDFTDSNDDEDEFVLPDKTSSGRKRKSSTAPGTSAGDANDNDAFLEWLQTKRERESMGEESNLLFLRSILPDMRKMTDKQNRRFRRKIISLMDDILDDADIDTHA